MEDLILCSECYDKSGADGFCGMICQAICAFCKRKCLGYEVSRPDSISRPPTPYLVICEKDGPVFLTETEYIEQLAEQMPWKCPLCNEDAEFSTTNYREMMDAKLEAEGRDPFAEIKEKEWSEEDSPF